MTPESHRKSVTSDRHAYQAALAAAVEARQRLQTARLACLRRQRLLRGEGRHGQAAYQGGYADGLLEGAEAVYVLTLSLRALAPPE